MKTFLKIALIVLIVIVLLIAGAAVYLTRGLSSGSKLVIGDVDLSLLDNGTYNGKYSAGRWSNEVNVVINDHKITEIDVVKDVTFPIPDVTKKLFDEIIQKQTTQVDVVSGATVTGKA